MAFRASGQCLMAMPIIGGSSIPPQLRVGLAMMIALLSAPLMPAMPSVDPLSLQAIVYAGQQVLIGVLLAFLLECLFAIFTTMGQILSMQMGLGMAMMNDPVNGVSVPAMGKYYQLYTFMLFLSLDGHLVALETFVRSFEIWPVGEFFSQHALYLIILRFGWLMGAALLLALPAMTAMLLVNGAFGMMNRAAPQLNVFALGFPMTLLLGLVCLLISNSGLPENFVRLSSDTLDMMRLLEGGTP
ncbi:flagellar biosynthesis protein FliR [Photobacterium aphoticum]|uniref:Flagellar biosynthetic protein FliR n=1 Tax=Photobacterium aphoticum TaxID=754436 RepID=A0A090QZN5_9GAMM|nr:flagellar biosynthesis protein FliR [Photobacterium aphoticum]